MSDDNPYVSLEDDTAPASHGAGTQSPYVSMEDDTPTNGPTPMRAMPDKRSEADYQDWVKSNSTHAPGSVSSEFHTPSMGDRTVTVDPYGNGVSTDLRAIYHNHSVPQRAPYARTVDVTPDMLDRFATPDSPTLTADSVYAKGQPASKLGYWDKDEDGKSVYRQPGYQPASTTDKIMGKAAKMASDTYDSIADTVKHPLDTVGKNLAQDVQDVKDVVVDPVVTGFQKARQAGNVLANQAGIQGPESAAAGITAAEKATPPKPAFRRAADEQMKQAGSAFGVLDAYLSNPRAALASAFQGLSEGGTSMGLAAGGGAAGGAAGGSVVPVAGTAVGGVVGTVVGAGAGGYMDAYGQTIVETIRASGVDMTDKGAVTAALKDPDLMARAQAAGRKAGIPAAIINAVSFGVAGKVFKPVAGAVTSKIGSDLAGKAAGVAAEGATQGGVAAGGEAARQKIQEGSVNDPAAIARAGTEQAALGGAFAGLHARGAKDADFTRADSKGFGDGKPFDVNDIPGVSPGAPGGPSSAAPALPAPTRALGAPPAEEATNAPAASPPSPPPTAQEKAQTVAEAADDPADIKADHGVGGSLIMVKGEPVAHADTPMEANRIVTDAKQQIDERRIDDAQRKKVSEMTPEEMKQTLLTHELTGIPNKRAYDESEKLPTQVHMDLDSLKAVNDVGGHDAGDAFLKAAADAMKAEDPDNIYHVSGDEFKAQTQTPEEAHDLMDRVNQRLQATKLEFTTPDGGKLTVPAIGLSYGVGTNANEAESALQQHKSSREQLGLRQPRGSLPTGATVESPPGQQTDEGHPAAEELPTQEVLGQHVTPAAEPTPAQAEAGNYHKPTVAWNGLPIKVETHAGGTRHGIGADGKPFSRQMTADYGYFPGTKGNDGDGVDVLMGTADNDKTAYVIDQNHRDGSFDEHKVVLGVHSPEAAAALYHEQYPKGWQGMRGITEMPAEQFKDWLKNGEKGEPAGRIDNVTTPSLRETEPPAGATNEPESATEAASGETKATKPETRSDLSPEESKFVKTVGDRTLGEFGQKAVSGLVEGRKLYEEITGTKLTPSTLKRVDELMERAIVETARRVVEDGDEPGVTFDRLVKLYERQPSLNTRTSTSIANQAYSTPAPLAYLASDLGGITHHTTVLEPTAGNGMLLIAADPAMATVNELNDERAASLRGQGFEVTQQNAVESVLGKDIDVVIANPPFGVVKDADGQSIGYQLTTPKGESVKTNEIDHAIVLKQLEAMKGDGRAVLLIGGVNKLAKTPEARSDAYNGAAKRKFFYHLYNNYNVVDHFTVAGELYSRQGAEWPIDAIVIHGVGKSALPLPAAAPPRVYASYPDLKGLLGKSYDRLDSAPQADAGAAARGAAEPVPEAQQGNLPAPALGANPADGGRLAGPEGGGEGTGAGDVRGRAPPGDGKLPAGGSGEPADLQQLGRVGEADEPRGVSTTDESETPASRELDGTPGPEVGPGRPAGAPEVVGEPDGSGGVGAQEPYQAASKLNPLGTLVPGNMRDSIRSSLKALEKEHGPADAFVAKEMGWKPGEVGDKLAAEQVDALALALKQIKAGKGFIIGDQTGIGKGRVVASIIEWTKQHGMTPIFMTEKPKLYGDMVRDLRDIGVRDIRPLMTNADEKIPLSDDDPNDVLKSKASAAHNKVLQAAVNEAKLADHNIVFTTYDQMNMQGGKMALRHELINTLAPNAVLILDESHNAGGTTAGRSNAKSGDKAGEKTGRAGFIRGLVGRSKGVFYSSATYAKRPDVMDLYFKTDMALAVQGNVAKLPGAIQAGGVPLQQVVASMLAESGQYIRRERSFNGVRYETPVSPVQRTAAEAISSMMLKVKEFDDLKAGAVAAAKKDAKKAAQQVSETNEAGAAGAQSTNFTSLMHNLISQMLLALKADSAADHAIEALKRGEKPVLTVANTMGSFIGDYAEGAGLKSGDSITLGFKDLMKRYLESSRLITIKDHNGKEIERRRMSDEELGREAIAAFNRAKKLIEETKEIQNLPVSPIDWMHHRLREAGYKTGEITGRQHTIEYHPDGSAHYKMRGDKDTSTAAKTRDLAKFNNGGIDAMILNRSGSTGLSMHASEKFKNQDQRHMIIAQAEGNIDTHMQMLGRIFRTGQVKLPIYSQLVADIPAEKRPAAILAKKMASLNANTTGARGSALTAKDSVDFLNDYGDEVVAQLMDDLPEVHEKLGEPLESSSSGAGYATEEAARKVTGRIPMLPVAEQEELYHLIETGYQERLAQADAMGENALEAKTLALDAKLVKRLTLTEGAKGDSPFAAGSYAEISDVKRVGKPYTSAEVRAQLAEKVGNATEDTPLASLAAQGRQNARAIIQQTMGDYRTYRNGEEAKMLEAETKEAAREGRLGMLDGVAKRWQELATAVHIGGSYEFQMQDGQSMMGIVTDITRKKGVKMPTALGAWVAKIALADGARQTQIPFSKMALQQHGDSVGKIKVNASSRSPLTGVPIEKMFDDGQSASREQRVIVTGNLLSGFTTFKNGQIVHFTDNQGNVRQGIMMPRSFKLEEALENAPVKIAPDKAAQFLRNANQAILKSSDGAVQVQRWGNSDFALSVAKSKAEGGKYFLDPDLRRLVGDFVSQGSGMRVMVNADQLQPVLSLIERKFDQKFETNSHRKEALEAGGTSLGVKSRPERDLDSDAMARGESAGSMTRDDVEKRAQGIIDGFRIKPKGLVVVQSAADLLKSDAGPNMRTAVGSGGAPIASYFPGTGKIYVVADAIKSPEHLAGIMAHEMVVHFGLRSMLGSPYSAEYRGLLANIAKALPAATAYHGAREIPNYDPTRGSHRQLGAEEALAYYEQAQAQGNKIPPEWRQWVDKVRQIVRDWLRRLARLPEKFDELYVKNVLNALRAHLRTGEDRGTGEGEARNAMPKDTFYSSVERAVDTAKRDKGTGPEWEATLRNMPGVKPEEMEWLGLKDWLQGRGRVTRQEVADYVRAHRIEVGEKLYGMGGTTRGEHIEALHEWMDENTDRDYLENNEIEENDQLVNDAANGDSRAIGELEMRGVPGQILAPFYDTQSTTGEDVDGAPRYPAHVEPGGKNYRELLLTLPQSRGQDVERMKALGAELNEANNAIGAYMRQYPGAAPSRDATLAGLTQLRDKISRDFQAARETNPSYRSGHWDEPNVLAHARFDERTLPTGERTMHVAEIQSDWHHAGWERGYQDGKPLVAAKAVRKDGYWEVTTADGQFVTNVLDRSMSMKLTNPDDVISVANKRLLAGVKSAQDNRVPDAPFKTTWQDLALKRLLRHAVDKGFDALSWDTGQTVADRFSLSRRIGSVALNGSDFRAYGHNGELVHSTTGMTRERAAQLIGKDAADKLYDMPVTKNGWRQLEGLDLDQGSEGKKAIYDKMLPQKMGKLVGKWGGKVERGQVGEAPHTDIQTAEERQPIEGHIVRITPEMRNSVLEGMPLFARPMFARAADEMESSEPDDGRTFLGRPGLLGKGYDLARKAVMFPATNQLAMDVRKLFNPRSLSDVSKVAANRMVPFLADLARQKEIALANLEQYSRDVDRLSYKQQLQAYHEAEIGERQSNPAMQPVMDALQKMLRDKAEQVQAMGPGHLDTFIDNYLPHYYTDESKAKKFFAGPFGRRPLRGPATFKKQRYYATLRDAMTEGNLTPLTGNPLIQTFLKLYEMDRYMMGVSMLRDGLKPDGLAKYFRFNQQVPEGWAKIDDPIARVSSWSEEEGGFVQRGYYAMPEDAARLLNNHLGVNHLANFSPAMTLRALANSMTMFQLGFSGFHVGFTSTDAMVSKTALAYERLMNGEPGRAMAAFLESTVGSPAGILMNLRRGRLLQKAYLNPTGSTPEMQAIANAFVGGGGRIRMPIEYQTAQGISPFHGVTLRHLVADLKAVSQDPQSSVFDYTKTLGNVALEYANKYWRTLTDMARTNPAWQLPFEALGRVVRMSTGFIMEKIVPWQKQGVFVDLARDYLRRNPTASPTEVNAEMQRITHSIDNRLGEVVYDNNFWNRSFKMALHLSLRAVGWRFGTLQELGGGAHDFLKAADTLLRTGRLSPKDFTHKMAYLMGLMTLQALSGALLQYLMTGEGPKDLKDIMFPRTGYLKKDGTPERLSLPTYIKDMYGYLTQPGHEVASMLNPILGELYYQIQNADYFGDPIYDPDDTGWQQFLERSEHFVKAYTPFVVQGTQHLEAAQQPGVVGALARVGNFFGLKPAPKSITNPQAVTEREHYEDEKRYEKKLRYDLRAAREAGDKEEVKRIQQRLQQGKEESARSHAEYMRKKVETEKKVQQQQKGGRTSELMDKVGPLIDGSSSRAEMAQRIERAGYPALAGLIGALPDTIRPQVRARLEEHA